MAGAALELRKLEPPGSLIVSRVGTRNLELLRNLGCHTLQGYAFAKPMAADDFIAFAKARSWMPAEKITPAKAS